MKHNRIESATAQPTAPPILLSWLAVFRPCFTAPVWNHILVLVGGAVLSPGKRTITQALRVMGLADQPGFGRYHEVLNRARWDARDVRLRAQQRCVKPSQLGAEQLPRRLRHRRGTRKHTESVGRSG